MAPPPARGWTPPALRADQRAAGSPACAGMDPTGPMRGPRFIRLPRLRGDGPLVLSTAPMPNMAPPPARGWTPNKARQPSGRGGSPACAGMDPVIPKASPLLSWLPRLRGDGPPRGPVFHLCERAPPPARGWTPDSRNLVGVADGSPACAGMDPARRPPRFRWPRLPRLRGDGPALPPGVTATGTAPPPARGWTRRAAACGFCWRGSPACAGMDPDA